MRGDPELLPIERRVWRLAFLLTGDADRAAELITSVLRTRPDPTTLDPARLDRLIVLRSREVARTASVSARGAPDDARRALGAALTLAPQPQEAWVLTRIDALDPLHVCRAMDCSRTAAGRHLDAADARMKLLLGDDHDRALVALRAWADSLDPRPLIASARARAAARRKRRLAIVSGAVVIGVLAALWLVLTIAA